MVNQFFRIGQLIYDIEASMAIDETAFESFLNNEFREMTLQLADQWYNHAAGVGYCLEFHKEECARLLKKVNAMYLLYSSYTSLSDGKEFMRDLYRLLIDHLNIQSVRIDKMIAEPSDFPLPGYNPN